jgi:hypothetical protein
VLSVSGLRAISSSTSTVCATTRQAPARDLAGRMAVVRRRSNPIRAG